MPTTKLQTVRKQLDYSSAAVIDLMLRRANQLGEPLMSPTSLKTKLSRWENGHEQVGLPIYRRIFREIYGRTDEELGFPGEPEDDGLDELRARVNSARGVDGVLVDGFRSQVENARHVDNRFGGTNVLDQLRSIIAQLEDLLAYSTNRGHRQELAHILTDASTLAGWQSLDRADFSQAWRLHETAKKAAREAGSSALLAHATAQQAFILIDIGEVAAAAEQLSGARAIAEGQAPPLLRSWLAAAQAEGHAALGSRTEALRTFDTANALLPNDPVDLALPFLFLGDGHLDRWRGNTLSRLGDPDAIDQLATALPRLPPNFSRARTVMLVDLAFAHAAAGDREGALNYARQARRLASQIKSDRQLRRLSSLILPSGARSA
jgi:hypothetical protein